MSRFFSYLNSAKQLITSYTGSEPFTSFSKKYFSENKKHGSADRKQIVQLCYCYFRTSHATKHLSLEEQIIAGLFLCSGEKNKLLNELKPDWNEQTDRSLKEKFSLIGAVINVIFPFRHELSDDIDPEKFSASFLTQPDLFLRIRPVHAENVLRKLTAINAAHEFISPFTIRLPNNFKVEDHFALNKEVVVQDLNSQRVMEMLPLRKGESKKIWDCCAGSGGKSIMAYDLDPSVELTVSDIRESIIINLKRRFTEAGIKKYKAFNLNATDGGLAPGTEFDLIICDAPCTGSGTWGRTPERLALFDEKEIASYSALQQKIVSAIHTNLARGGYLLYITCSVFKKENEDIVELLTKKFKLELTKMELLRGYDKKADTLFVALLKHAS